MLRPYPLPTEDMGVFLLLKLQFRKRSNLKVICDAAELVSCNETQASEIEYIT
jgi:hypothetical protein